MAAASRNHQVLKHTIRLFSSPRKMEGLAAGDEFDESDVWCFQPESKPDMKSSVPRSRSTWKMNQTATGSGSGSKSGPGSMPVRVPDWSKILLHESKSSVSYCNRRGFEEEEEDDGEAIVPPHEVVMRRRAASLSVEEGAGRTLKGRDLSRVRNAIWAKTGFQD
ncbi:uncharacterized protein A4U43_C07F20530 [Asparagus officinalis]|uniref:Senescence regulator n=1 Tax=Asparagus officinalis TaxID=4686 RepID=A0A5P1EDH8_ASPOF|nr:uncharacterized protein LOC109850909 [Asparagus officinalis]ONK63945.1 uncharacterized protein A4U43_C07F20530 [Asparagus officinalis]